MGITTERLKEILLLLNYWLQKKHASIKEIQSLLGELNFIGACVKSSRIFINRLLNWLREYDDKNHSLFDIPEEVKKDIFWWNTFLPLYNGISLISYGSWSEPDAIFSSYIRAATIAAVG